MYAACWYGEPRRFDIFLTSNVATNEGVGEWGKALRDTCKHLRQRLTIGPILSFSPKGQGIVRG